MAVKKGKGERKIPLREVIAEEAEAAERDEMGVDEEFNPDRDLGSSFSGPRAFQRDMRDRDQLVIDELLASLPKNQGYYLKLYRELGPGRWEFKEKIDQYDTWTDMELEVVERVRSYTKKFGSKKWGTGLYRIVVWRNGGIRERNKYPPTDIAVDAGDADGPDTHHTGKLDPMEAVNEQMNAFGGLMTAMQHIMPKTVDPNVQFQSIIQAFLAGKDEKREAARQDTNAMTTMMSTMMTAMMGLVTTMMQQKNAPVEVGKPFEEQMAGFMNMMKSFGFGQQQAPKGVAEQLAEMKLLGFDPFKKEDTIEQIAKLKALTGSLVDIMPNGQQVERPGIFEKLVDAIAPHVPKMFSDLRAMTDNAAMAQKLQQLRIEQERLSNPQPIPMEDRPTTRYGQPVGPQHRMGAGDAFSEPPNMDPYSGFTTRPFQPRTEEAAGIEMFGTVEGASAEDMRRRAAGEPITQSAVVTEPVQPPQQPLNGNGKPPIVHEPTVEMPPMLSQIYEIVRQDLRSAYGPLYESLMMDPSTQAIIQTIQQKQASGAVLSEELAKTGFSQFADKGFIRKATDYFDGFVEWVLANTITKVTGGCPLCEAAHIFENQYEFLKSDRKCGAPAGGTETCPGDLILKTVQDATQAA